MIITRVLFDAICVRLARGDSVRMIADRVGCSRPSVDRACAAMVMACRSTDEAWTFFKGISPCVISADLLRDAP